MIRDDAAPVPIYDDSPNDLAALFGILFSHKYLIAGITFVFALAAVVVALTTTPFFRAEVVVTEVRDKGIAGAASNLANQLGGLASLAGINLAQDPGPGANAQALLTSRRLAEEFVTREDLLPILSKNAPKPPTFWEAIEDFRLGIVDVQQNRRDGVTTVAMEWTDPAIAAQWANGYVALANELLRTRALDEASRNISYLNEQIAKTNVVDLQKVMYNLVQTETQKLMLASARTEFALTVIDPAVAPEVRVRPNRRMMVATGGVFGLLFGSAIAVAFNAYRRRTQPVRIASARNPEAHS